MKNDCSSLASVNESGEGKNPQIHVGVLKSENGDRVCLLHLKGRNSMRLTLERFHIYLFICVSNMQISYACCSLCVTLFCFVYAFFVY